MKLYTLLEEHDQTEICTYCGNTRGNKRSCCGEVHFEKDPDLKEATNHMGEREYQTYSGWKAACKKAYPGCGFRGDKDIGAATLDGKDVGEWDGAVGSVYAKQVNEVSKATLKSYVNKAAEDAVRASGRAAFKAGTGEYADARGEEDDAKSEKRLKGISKATDKLVKKSTLSEYIEIQAEVSAQLREAEEATHQYRIHHIDHDICVQERQTDGTWETVRAFNEISSDYAHTNAREYKKELEDKAAQAKVTESAEPEKQWYIVTPTGTRVGKGLPTRDAAFAKWKTISEKMRKGLKIVEESLSIVAEAGQFYIVTPEGTKVGKAHPSRDAALAKWRTISEKNRVGLKIIEESVVGINELLIEDDTMADVLNAKDAIAAGSEEYQHFLAKLRARKGEAYSTEVHKQVQHQQKANDA